MEDAQLLEIAQVLVPPVPSLAMEGSVSVGVHVRRAAEVHDVQACGVGGALRAGPVAGAQEPGLGCGLLELPVHALEEVAKLFEARVEEAEGRVVAGADQKDAHGGAGGFVAEGAGGAGELGGEFGHDVVGHVGVGFEVELLGVDVGDLEEDEEEGGQDGEAEGED